MPSTESSLLSLFCGLNSAHNATVLKFSMCTTFHKFAYVRARKYIHEGYYAKRYTEIITLHCKTSEFLILF